MKRTIGFASLLACSALFAPNTARAVGDQTPAEIKTQLREIFEDEAFTYCHEENAALFPLDKEYCELVETKNAVCPALPKVCQNEMEPTRLENLPQGRLRFGREGKDYGPPPKEGDKDYSDYSADGSGTGKTGSGDGKGDGSDGRSGDGKSGDGKSGDGTGAGSGNGDSDSGSKKGEKEKGSKDSQKEAKDPKDEKKPKEKPPPPEQEPIMVPGWLSMLARLFFYLIIAVVVGAIGYFIYKNLVKGKDSDDEAGPDDKPDAPEERAVVPRGPIETDVDRLLARARSLAQAGKYEEAIDAAYAALLRRLEGDGVIDLHPSRTNGDYVRSIRNLPDLKQALRSIASDVESVQFGDTQASPSTFQSVYSRVLPLVGRTAAVLLVLLAASNATSCDSRATALREAAESTSGDSLAVGKKQVGGSAPSGLSGLVQLLERNDKTVTVRRPRAADDTGYPADGTIVVLPGTPIDAATWASLRRWIDRDNGTLIVAGYRNDLALDGVSFKHTTTNSPVRAGSDSVLYVGRSMTLKLPHLGALVIPAPKTDPKRPYFVPPQRVQAVLKRDDGLVYAAQIDSDELKGGKIFAFADDRLFANIALTIGDNAAYLAEFFKYQGGSDVEIWDEPQGLRAGGGSGDGTIQPGEEPTSSNSGAGGSGNPLDSLAKANLLPIILQLMALVVLYLLYRGTRFGKPREPKEVSRRAYADHSRALGMTYARADASRHATALFSIWALDRLRDRYLKGGNKGLSPLAESIAARTGRPIGEVMTVLMEATGARDEIAPPSSYRGSDMVGGNPGGPPQERRKFWVMEELDRYLDAVKGSSAAKRRSK